MRSVEESNDAFVSDEDDAIGMFAAKFYRAFELLAEAVGVEVRELVAEPVLSPEEQKALDAVDDGHQGYDPTRLPMPKTAMQAVQILVNELLEMGDHAEHSLDYTWDVQGLSWARRVALDPGLQAKYGLMPPVEDSTPKEHQ